MLDSLLVLKRRENTLAKAYFAWHSFLDNPTFPPKLLPEGAIFMQENGDMWDPASRVSVIPSGTHNKLHEHRTETDVNYCLQMYSDRTLRLYFVCNCTPNLELFDQGSCVRTVTRP